MTMRPCGAVVALLLLLTACGGDDPLADGVQAGSTDPQASPATVSADTVGSEDSVDNAFVPPADVRVATGTAIGTLQLGDQTFMAADGDCQLGPDRYRFTTRGDVAMGVTIIFGPPMFLAGASVGLNMPEGRQEWFIAGRERDPVIEIWDDGLQVSGIARDLDASDAPRREMVLRAECQF